MLLRGIMFFSVGVHCDLEILKKRERQRGDRKIGLAESQYETIHDGVNYDFEINTSKLDAKTVATSIVTAFRRT